MAAIAPLSLSQPVAANSKEPYRASAMDGALCTLARWSETGSAARPAEPPLTAGLIPSSAWVLSVAAELAV